MIKTPTPKQLGFWMPAEWYPHTGCWMAWPCHVPTWTKIGLDRARRAYALVASAIAQYEPVTMLVHPEDEESARLVCNSEIQIMLLPIDDSWVRDTGPSFLIDKLGHLAGVHWKINAWGKNYTDYTLDEQIAPAILLEAGAQCFQAPLIMEGGSFSVDGLGTLLTTKECLLNSNRNPDLSQSQIEQYLCDYLGAEQVIWLNKGLIGDETDGHVDEIACFIGPGKILCITTNDKEDPNYNLLQENLNILKSAVDTQGQPFEIFTVEQPPATFLNGERLTLSYINFYKANKGIVMPAFGYEAYDKAAYHLFEKLFPGVHITLINALDVFAGGGGIHCITQQQPVRSTLSGDNSKVSIDISPCLFKIL
ncbi:MAG: agmatine deiminase family protein [Legionella sp.]|nr:agmatine deiminase family protein [Legionella sp.]